MANKITARHILVDKKTLAEDVIEEINSGAKFEEMAKKYSVSPSVIRIWKKKGLVTSHLLCGDRRLLYDDPGDLQPVMISGIWVKNPALNT